MAIATATALGIAGIAAGVGGAAISAHAAGSAANQQANAANQASNLSAQSTAQAIAEQQRQFNITQGNMAPWLNMGQSSLGQLGYLLGLPKMPQAPTGARPGVPGVRPGMQRPLPGGLGGLGTGIRPRGEMNPRFSPQLSDGGSDYNLTRGPDGTWSYSGDEQSDELSGPAPPEDRIDDAPPNDLAGGGGEGGGAPVPPGVNPSLGGFGSLSQDFGEEFNSPEFFQPFDEQFQAPDPNNLQNDKGFNFRLREGIKALENSAAARGNLYTGGLLKDLTGYAQGLASDEYDRAYGRAAGEYGQRYNIHLGNLAGRGDAYNRSLNEFRQRYDIFNQNQTNRYNRLAALAGFGQTAAGQLASSGANSANQIGNIAMAGAANQGGFLQAAANARAGGSINSANAWNSALGSGFNNLQQLLLARQPISNTSG